MKILVVEDEDALATGLRFNFEQEGYDVDVVSDGPSALKRFEPDAPPVDLVILDLMLPGMSGYEIAAAIRKVAPDTPILVLSARTLSEDKAHAFDCGVDQYLTKPFALPELLARVRNLLKRRARALAAATTSDPAPSLPEKSDVYEFDDVRVDFRTFEVHHAGQVHRLTTMEAQLLRYFLQNEGTVLSRSRILRDVWDESAEITTRSIDNFVLRLRKYIEVDPSQPTHLLSVRGTGYQFFTEPSQPDAA